MKIGITTVQAPFIHGGADHHASGLLMSLQNAGHEVDLITMPFRFHPVGEVLRSMDIWQAENFEQINGYRIDLVICLKFPTYYLQHANKITWLLHQHRSIYELWDTSYSEGLCATEEGQRLKEEVTRLDTLLLPTCQRIYANSERVAQRLKYFNKIDSTPLYHPPQWADQFYTRPAEAFIFYPSRLEDLKRQALLIKAMQHVRSPVSAIIAGDGGKIDQLRQLIDDLQLNDRVRLLGRVPQKELLAYYALCLGVFFGPFDEDYGYITLEAMLSAKPVITCSDSGGPLEFVIHGETGFVVDPDPGAVAEKIENLYRNRKRAAEMGRFGLARYRALNITWERVVETLVQ